MPWREPSPPQSESWRVWHFLSVYVSACIVGTQWCGCSIITERSTNLSGLCFATTRKLATSWREPFPPRSESWKTCHGLICVSGWIVGTQLYVVVPCWFDLQLDSRFLIVWHIHTIADNALTGTIPSEIGELTPIFCDLSELFSSPGKS